MRHDVTLIPLDAVQGTPESWTRKAAIVQGVAEAVHTSLAPMAKPQRYNPMASCSKCSGSEIGVRFEARRNRMRRKCYTCGHEWDELPLDVKEDRCP